MLEKLARWAQLRRSRKQLKRLVSEYNSYDLVDFLFDSISTMFVDFYENGQLDSIDWSWAVNYTKARDEMAKIYKWLKVIYPKHLNKIDEIYFACLAAPSLKQSQLLTKLGATETWLRNCQQKYLMKIVSIREYLWT